MSAVTDSEAAGRARRGTPGLEPAELRALARPAYTSAAAHVALEWVAISAAVAAIAAHPSPLVVAAGAVWIGARQHALAALAHEAAHGRLLPGRWNDLVGEALLAWPLFLSLERYRRAHLAHHGHLSTTRDPDWRRNRADLWPASGWRRRLRLLAGLDPKQRGAFTLFVDREPARAASRRRRAARLAFYAATAVVLTWAGGWRIFALAWLLPWGTWFLAALRLRGISEHWAVDAPPAEQTRTLRLGPLGRLLLLPKNMGYHVEHHRYPSVPFQRLPELHARLAARGALGHETRGLIGLARELTARPQRT